MLVDEEVNFLGFAVKLLPANQKIFLLRHSEFNLVRALPLDSVQLFSTLGHLYCAKIVNQ